LLFRRHTPGRQVCVGRWHGAGALRSWSHGEPSLNACDAGMFETGNYRRYVCRGTKIFALWNRQLLFAIVTSRIEVRHEMQSLPNSATGRKAGRHGQVQWGARARVGER